MNCKPKHLRPVHFNRGRHGHVWLCLACGTHLAGPKLPDDEREVLVEYAKALVGNGKDLRTRKGLTADEANGEDTMTESTMQITLTFGVNASPTDIAAALRRRAGLFEGMSPKDAGARENTDSEPAPVKKTAAKKAPPVVEAEETEEDDDDFAPKKKAASKKVAGFDDEDGGEETATESEDEDDDSFAAPAPAKKTAAKKAPKITVDDVNDACKAKSKETDRATVLAILKKKFKVASINDLKPEQYAAVIEAMTGE